MVKLWVGSLFCSARREEHSPGRAAASTPGGARQSQGGDQGCLNTTLKCEPIGDDFNAALILPGGIDIKVTEPDVHGHRGTGLSAYAGCSMLEVPAPGTKDA